MPFFETEVVACENLTHSSSLEKNPDDQNHPDLIKRYN